MDGWMDDEEIMEGKGGGGNFKNLLIAYGLWIMA